MRLLVNKGVKLLSADFRCLRAGDLDRVIFARPRNSKVQKLKAEPSRVHLLRMRLLHQGSRSCLRLASPDMAERSRPKSYVKLDISEMAISGMFCAEYKN